MLNNNIYCVDCSEKCHQCKTIIEKSIIVDDIFLNNNIYCVDCSEKCQECKTILEKSITIDGKKYCLECTIDYEEYTTKCCCCHEIFSKYTKINKKNYCYGCVKKCNKCENDIVKIYSHEGKYCNECVKICYVCNLMKVNYTMIDKNIHCHTCVKQCNYCKKYYINIYAHLGNKLCCHNCIDYVLCNKENIQLNMEDELDNLDKELNEVKIKVVKKAKTKVKAIKLKKGVNIVKN
jgi:hypothetical protein